MTNPRTSPNRDSGYIALSGWAIKGGPPLPPELPSKSMILNLHTLFCILLSQIDTMSFHESSTDIELEDDHILKANLRNEDGDEQESTLDLNEFIGNDNGMFLDPLLSLHRRHRGRSSREGYSDLLSRPVPMGRRGLPGQRGGHQLLPRGRRQCSHPPCYLARRRWRGTRGRYQPLRAHRERQWSPGVCLALALGSEPQGASTSLTILSGTIRRAWHTSMNKFLLIFLPPLSPSVEYVFSPRRGNISLYWLSELIQYKWLVS